MTEPNGFEYVLETTQQRTTSIIMRKAPNNATLVQRTPTGIVSMELTEDVREQMIGLFAPLPVIADLPEGVIFTEKRKPGRPPKAA